MANDGFILFMGRWQMIRMDGPSRRLPRTVEGIGFSLADAAWRLTHCPALVVVRDPATKVSSIVAASVGTDRRLWGMTVAPESAAGRACAERLTAYAQGGVELLGGLRADRRREQQGVVVSLADGPRSVGALVVFAPPGLVERSTHDHLVALAGEAGFLIGQLVAERFSKQLGLIDAITGQANRPGLERAMRDTVPEECSLVCMAIDQLDALDIDLGNAALKQVATLLKTSVRDYDVPARIAEYEFAVFLPGAAMDGAVLVADRVRAAVSESPFDLGGTSAVTCSLGIASVPDTVAATEDLVVAAVEARQGGRESGPNRIATLHQS